MKKVILLTIIGFSLNAKAESIDFNALIIEVEASIAQQAKRVVTVESKLRQPASTQNEVKQDTQKADSDTTSHQ